MTLFDAGNLVHALLVTAAGEGRLEPDGDDFAGRLGRNQARAKRQDVGIVVLAAVSRRSAIIA